MQRLSVLGQSNCLLQKHPHLSCHTERLITQAELIFTGPYFALRTSFQSWPKMVGLRM